MKLGTEGKKKLKQLEADYDLASAYASERATLLAEQWDILQRANDAIACDDLAKQGDSGSPYQNPAIGIRHKSIVIIDELYENLAPFKRSVKAVLAGPLKLRKPKG